MITSPGSYVADRSTLARCSTVANGSGPKNDTRRSSATSGPGADSLLSTALRLGTNTMAVAMSSRPTPASVARAPKAWMSGGATAEQRPARSERTSHQAGRNHPLQGTVDGHIVDEISDPDGAEEQVRPESRVREREQDHRHSPARYPRSEAARHLLPADQRDGKRCAKDAASAERCAQQADAGRAEAEQIQGDDDREHSEDPAAKG